MARGVNKVILIGNLGADPEVRQFSDGSSVANLSLATSERWVDKQTGEMQERTEWHRLVAYRRLAEVASEYLAKGSKVYVEGKLQTRKWQDPAGQDRYTTEIVVRELQMLDVRQGPPADIADIPADTPSRPRPRITKPGVSRGQAPAAQQDFDDDIPF